MGRSERGLRNRPCFHLRAVAAAGGRVSSTGPGAVTRVVGHPSHDLSLPIDNYPPSVTEVLTLSASYLVVKAYIQDRSLGRLGSMGHLPQVIRPRSLVPACRLWTYLLVSLPHARWDTRGIAIILTG